MCQCKFTCSSNYLERDQVPNNYINIERKPILEVKRNLFVSQSNKAKRWMVGINSHLHQVMQGNDFKIHKLWCTDYLNSTKCEDGNIAQITVYFRLVRQIQTLDEKFIKSKLDDYRQMGDGQATHLVEQVVYGADIIWSLWRRIDWRSETKETAEHNVYRAAKKYFDQIVDENLEILPPQELENVSYTILSNLENGREKGDSFRPSNRFLRIINKAQLNSPLEENWRPIEIVLRHMPCSIENRLIFDKMNDIKLDIEQNFQLVKEESIRLSNYLSLRRVPPWLKIIQEICDSLPLLSDVIEKSDQQFEDRKTLASLLASMNDWLKLRHDEFQMIDSLMKDNCLSILDLEEIKTKTQNDEKNAKVFVLRVRYVIDELTNDIIKMMRSIINVEPSFNLPVFNVFSSGKAHLTKVNNKLKEFAKRAESGHSDSNFYVGLVSSDSCSSSFEEGDVMSFKYSIHKRKLSTNEAGKQNDLKTNVHEHTSAINTQNRIIVDATHSTNYDVYSENERSNTVCTIVPVRKDMNHTIAEMFKQSAHSQLIKHGHPEVYRLKVRGSSTSSDFQWLDIGQSKGASMTKHKVIILMGATGCGKSTLINGMINYILGVKWNDPFRFKCIHEDESIVRNQALSQTSSVTAYTIHHHEGMNIPYSLTIIDTPGYGDTRGIARDKEITQMIHQFLTQKDARIDQIHAACFVAASGECRLTVTQCYILDSVLSIFGKDFKDNIRLLVTFADNADPPVVDACQASHFPVTAPSAGITYSKFNSSVLYASNDQEESFDELFWDMGQENFEKFFTMLEKMDGKDLTSTREVIHRRQHVNQSLKDIEHELELCLVKIENMEMFQRKMLTFGHNMEANKNYVIEKTEMCLQKIDYTEKENCAYNCRLCNKTCLGNITNKEMKKICETKQCPNKMCQCPDAEHFFEPFELRLVPVKVETTLEKMKGEYESNRVDKLTMEECLVNCSQDLKMTKAKVMDLLGKLGDSAHLLDSAALRSSTLTPTDYRSLMRSRVAEERKPGYLIRLETLTELQKSLATQIESTMRAHNLPIVASYYAGGSFE